MKWPSILLAEKPSPDSMNNEAQIHYAVLQCHRDAKRPSCKWIWHWAPDPETENCCFRQSRSGSEGNLVPQSGECHEGGQGWSETFGGAILPRSHFPPDLPSGIMSSPQSIAFPNLFIPSELHEIGLNKHKETGQTRALSERTINPRL